MKYTKKISLLLAIIVFAQLLILPVCAEEETIDVSVLKGCRGIDSLVPLLGSSEFTGNAQSVFLFESNTDTLMYAWNPDKQLHPAGMVKILTGLIAIEKGNLNDVVTVSEDVINTVPKDARTSELQTGEVFTVEQLLYCVMVEGSNDGAAVLAHHIAGSQEAFVQMMNDYASEIGCTSTLFTNVHGLHDENQLTTARDVTRIIDTAIENELFRTLFGTTHYTVGKTNKSEERELESSNHLMHEGMYEIYYDYRVTGGRTGVNNTGLRCIATTSHQDNLDLICVVMGSESKINDRGIVERIGGFYETQDLMDMGFTGFETAVLLFEGMALKQYAVQNGSADVVVGPVVTVQSVVPKGSTLDTLTYRYSDIAGAFTAPIQKGQKVSYVEIWSDNVCVAQAELYAINDVAVSYQQIISNSNDGLPLWAIILIVIVAAVVVGFGSLYAIRHINIRKRKKHRR